MVHPLDHEAGQSHLRRAEQAYPATGTQAVEQLVVKGLLMALHRVGVQPGEVIELAPRAMTPAMGGVPASKPSGAAWNSACSKSATRTISPPNCQ